ncbi:MAG: type IV toxin-antitoxin system AbiEi family antitoxin domain-containing protein [Planctomycetes bacterium]|nr:type IV toxin-antitoxin system AbiEi family antitoxin domain-containing protein [Planctomycetota bacterium]
MGAALASSPRSRKTAALIRQRIERGGERLWRLEDFRDLPISAVARALSRLVKTGLIERLSKGTYYRTRQTSFGTSRPNPSAMQRLASRRKTVFPSGVAAANLLGLTTQAARQGEVATSALSLPRKLVGPDTVIHTRRPEAWSKLSQTDAALLDLLRRAGATSELSPTETIRRTIALLSERSRFWRILGVADTEPPRVRAMLGALGERLGRPAAELRRLRDSLNPLSRFDFGMFTGLANARAWQAKERR